MKKEAEDEFKRQATLGLLGVKKDLANEHSTQYYSWLRLVISLATGKLALLVSLYNIYKPDYPIALDLLIYCWSLLAASITSGLLALYGQTTAPLEAARKVDAAQNKMGVEKTYALVAYEGVNSSPRKIFHTCYVLSIAFFLMGLASLVWFATLNLQVP